MQGGINVSFTMFMLRTLVVLLRHLSLVWKNLTFVHQKPCCKLSKKKLFLLRLCYLSQVCTVGLDETVSIFWGKKGRVYPVFAIVKRNNLCTASTTLLNNMLDWDRYNKKLHCKGVTIYTGIMANIYGKNIMANDKYSQGSAR